MCCASHAQCVTAVMPSLNDEFVSCGIACMRALMCWSVVPRSMCVAVFAEVRDCAFVNAYLKGVDGPVNDEVL